MAKANDNSAVRASKAKSTAKKKSFRKVNKIIFHVNSETRKEIETSFITKICAAASHIDASDKDPNNTPYLFTASQINTDLTLAAQCEFEEDISTDDPDQGFFDLLRSVAFAELRKSFIEAALTGDEYAFATAGWRLYSAGKLSPDRLAPDTRKIREERYAARVARETNGK